MEGVKINNFTTEIFTFITVLVTCIIALFTYLSVKQTKNSVKASYFQNAIDNMGKIDFVAESRGLIKKKLWDQKQNSLREIEIPKEFEKKYKLNFHGEQKAIRLAEAVGRVSASLDRAACLMLTFFRKRELSNFINLFGDVFIDNWALCFKYLEYEQTTRYSDIDSRMFFELMTYICIDAFKKNQRFCKTFFLFDESIGNDQIKIRMEKRKKYLEKKIL